MPLTDTTARNAKPKDKPYKLSDSAGLYLLVKPNGKKYWRLKYYFASKEKLLSIGIYPMISLSEAREKCLVAKKQLGNNIDPSEYKKGQKLKHSINIENSFKSIVIEWHNNQKQVWTERHAVYILRRIEADVFPAWLYLATVIDLYSRKILPHHLRIGL